MTTRTRTPLLPRLRQSGWLLTGFVALLLVHFSEHAVQMWQIHGEHVHRPMATAILGNLWPWGVKTEVLHFGFAVFMLAGMAFFMPQFSDRIWRRDWSYQAVREAALVSQPIFWLALTGLWQGVHLFEHTILFSQYLRDVPRTGFIMDLTGVQRAEMHFTFTTIALLLMFRAFQLNWYGWGWTAPWSFWEFFKMQANDWADLGKPERGR